MTSYYSTELVQHMNIQVHTDTNIGQTSGEVTVEEISNGLGGRCWKASAEIETIFGQPVDAEPLFGIGRTPEEAIVRFRKAMDQFNESLWL